MKTLKISLLFVINISSVAIPLGLDLAIIARCGNSLNGDYQCNNAMALTKALKGIANYKGRPNCLCLALK
jgi:hypothetical protein